MKRFIERLALVCLVISLVLNLAPNVFSQQASIGQYSTIEEYERATGKKITKFSESPMLADLVKQGKLPSVEKRLPEEPIVIQPIEEVGKYGGTWRRAALSPNDTRIRDRMGYEPLVKWGRDGKTMVPNLVKSWELTNRGKTYVFYLRKGVKWSDGEPFTADDIMFWYNDVILNKELTPLFPAWLASGDKPVEVVKRDDYTVEFRFAAPYSIFLNYLAGPDTGVFITNYPKHYLQKFHPKYTPKEKLDSLVKEAKFDSWFQLFADKANPNTNPELPTIRPWVLKSNPTATRLVAERNPYYWKIDTVGNQLPYIDKVAFDIVQDTQMAVMKAVSGELDMQGRHMSLADYTLLMENRTKGNYDVYLWNEGKAGTALYINQNYKGDEDITKLFRNVKFRTALSLAINRDEINALVYLGQGRPCYVMFPFTSLQNDPNIRKLYEYNVAEANRLLDSLRLNRRNKDGFRLLPNGKPLQVTLLVGLGYPMHPDVSELVKTYWEKVGVKTAIDTVSQDLWWSRVQANNYQIVPHYLEFCEGFLDMSYSSMSFIPCRALTYFAPLWGLYYESLGKNGEKPTGDALRSQMLFDKLKTSTSKDEQDKLTEELLRVWAQNLWAIPTAGSYKIPIVVKKNFKNVPKNASLAYSYCSPGYLNPEQFFFEE
ncbi:MAG TPA: ABC transporter substrate-binding protein [bacterium]|nr:ABC transporter substrate-binding protein [bacterium]